MTIVELLITSSRGAGEDVRKNKYDIYWGYGFVSFQNKCLNIISKDCNIVLPDVDDYSLEFL